MSDLLLSAKNLYRRTESSLVYLTRDGHSEVSQKPGVAPLLELLSSKDDCEGGAAADKVVGRAAGFLYVLIGCREVYAEVASQGAFDLLKRYGIALEADKIAPFISNREGTGHCPLEEAVKDDDEPASAYLHIQAKLQELKEGKA